MGGFFTGAGVSFWEALRFCLDYWYVIILAVACIFFFPGVIQSLVRLMTETAIGRYITIGFLVVFGGAMAYFANRNAIRAQAFKEVVRNPAPKTKHVPPTPKPKTTGFKLPFGR